MQERSIVAMGEAERNSEPTTPSDDGDSFPFASEASSRLDAAELTTWVTQFHAPLFRYAYRLAGRQADAEDLTQQTFLIALQRGGSIRDPQRILGWLFSVLRNCYLKVRRKKSPIASENLELELDALPAFAGKDRWEEHDLQETLNALPDEFKIVVLLFYFEDASYKEIADRLQIPIGTVMSRLSRAKGQLRALLLGSVDESPLPPASQFIPCVTPPTR